MLMLKLKTTNTACTLSFSGLITLVIYLNLVPPDGIAPYRFLQPLARTDIPFFYFKTYIYKTALLMS